MVSADWERDRSLDLMRRRAVIGLIALAAALPACGESAADEPAPEAAGDAPELPIVNEYRPLAEEAYPEAKRLASQIAARAVSYNATESAADVARALASQRARAGELRQALESLRPRGQEAVAETVYPQLSGVTSETLGAMVLVRQHTRLPDGEILTQERIVDVRLAIDEGRWVLDDLGSVGGAPPPDVAISDAAREVLDDPRIHLSDSARWDVLAGRVDEGLLRALALAAKQRQFAVGVIQSGHPPNVWGTSRPSAHSRGAAADIWAVQGDPVVRQREVGSSAFGLAGDLLAGGAAQLGSPWILGAGGSRSFTDEVHQDHIHVQQTSF